MVSKSLSVHLLIFLFSLITKSRRRYFSCHKIFFTGRTIKFLCLMYVSAAAAETRLSRSSTGEGPKTGRAPPRPVTPPRAPHRSAPARAGLVTGNLSPIARARSRVPHLIAGAGYLLRSSQSQSHNPATGYISYCHNINASWAQHLVPRYKLGRVGTKCKKPTAHRYRRC